MTGHDPAKGIAENYREFARLEAHGRSPAYETLAESVAGDPAILRFLTELPPEKRQPNLLFAAARYLLGAPADIAHLRAMVSQASIELSEQMLARRTQTNEPARCTALMPALAQLPQPLALLEVGASAGLTLLVDRYSYDYGGHQIAGSDPRAPTLRCAPQGPVPLPARLPQVIWRAGLDINPLDVNNDDDVRWLGCLLWPVRATASSASPRRSRPPAATRRRCTAVTCSTICPRWPPRRQPRRPWSCTTPPCWPTSPWTSGGSSPQRSRAWGPSGCRTKAPAWYLTCRCRPTAAHRPCLPATATPCWPSPTPTAPGSIGLLCNFAPPGPNVASLCLFVQREDAGHAGFEVCRCGWGTEAADHACGNHPHQELRTAPVILADRPALS